MPVHKVIIEGRFHDISHFINAHHRASSKEAFDGSNVFDLLLEYEAPPRLFKTPSNNIFRLTLTAKRDDFTGQHYTAVVCSQHYNF